MKVLTLLFCISFIGNTMAEVTSYKLIKLKFAYPALGTVISAQVGLVLEKTDIFKKHGFDATVKGLGTGKELKTAILAEQADAIFTSESNFLVLRANKFEVLAISSLGSAGRLALVVKNNGKINKLEELTGKKIGALFGTTVHLRALEWKNKIDPKGIELINLGSIAALSSALESNSVDAIMMWDPFLEDAIRNKKVKLLGTSDFDLIDLVSKSYANKNPQAIEKLNAAFVDAFYYFITHKEEVNKWYAESLKISPETLDAASKINKNYNVKKVSEININITPELIGRMDIISDFLFNEKVIPEKPEIKSFLK
ncbi:MAG: ABC transporter substrate-binding protein [Bacteriovorax sp.]|nr:ABC transporter substrate-binding protein [Bacteriovorax sp.]